MTRWYEPIAMFRLLLRIWATRNLTGQREHQPAQPTKVLDHGTTTGDFWFDYVADLGDGFDPTMAVAWHLGRTGFDREQIDPRIGADAEFRAPDDIPLPPDDDIPEHLPRGRLLVMGGDEVYPDASDARYRNQTVGPYGLAWEGSVDGTGSSALLAIPANHDWYGGSGPFRRAFCAGRSIGGWETVQECTWWSARLAHGWWIWGVDTALDGTVNQGQLDYFRAAAEEMDADDRLIVCIPVPAWRLRERHVDRLDHLARFLFMVGVEPEVFLSGDYHVSALHRRDVQRRDPETDEPVADRIEWHLTCGGGGAFQHPVHNLDDSIPDTEDQLPEPGVADAEPFRLIASWPSDDESRAGTGGWWHLLFDKAAYTLVATLAALQLVVMALVRADRRGPELDSRSVIDTLVDHLVTGGVLGPIPIGGLLMAGVVAIATFVLARSNSAATEAMRWARSVGFGHGLVQATVFTTAALGGNLVLRTQDFGPIEGWAVLAGAAVLGAIASIVVLGSYLRLANQRFRMHDNESYSARASGDNRHFARFRISPDGSLSCYVIALRTTGQGWADGLTGAGPVPPADTSEPELIDVRFRTAPHQFSTESRIRT